MNHHSFATLVLLVVVSSGPEPAAQPTVDQSFLVGPGGGSGLEVTGNQWVAQTFTVGITGQLASVAMELREHRCPGTHDLTIKVVTTDAMGVPEVLSTPLAEIVVPPGSVSPLGGPYALFVFDVLPFAIQVTVGDVLGILLETAVPGGACTYAWGAAIGGYAAGSSYLIFSPPSTPSAHVRDMGFETSVLVGPPPPSCTMSLPASPASGVLDVMVDTLSPSAAVVDILVELSLDAGITYQPVTMDASSPAPNPAPGTPTGPTDFRWDSRADGVGLVALAAGVIVRATIDDRMSPTTGDCQGMVDIDNTQICFGICGDCNLSGTGPDVLDALTAAQIAAGLLVPTPVQEACCDVDVSTQVDVIDALLIAQDAAGLPVALMCV